MLRVQSGWRVYIEENLNCQAASLYLDCNPSIIMHCISRYTDDTYAQLFGDGRHKFYLEFRCSRPCLKGLECCAKCAEKSPSTVLQHSRKFNHGNTNEPIPDGSHIFGGKWYYEAARKWGPPPSEIVEFAMQYQKEARGDFVVEEPRYDDESYKAEKLSESQEMPRAKKTAIPTTEGGGGDAIAPPKRTRKPKVAATATAITTTPVTEETVAPAPKSRARKPKVAPEEGIEGATVVTETPKKRGGRKKMEDTPYSSLVSNTNTMVHKEAVLPTHIESNLEKVDVDGYEIEYVKLSTFEVGETTYYRDSRKNKLYKRLKEAAIGAYVGRWNPDTSMIVTEIPDSDDEN